MRDTSVWNRRDMSDHALGWSARRQLDLWPGPLRLTPQKPLIDSPRCVGLIPDPTRVGLRMRCDADTINGDFLCYACKDPEGYRARLAAAMAAVRQRTLEAHPVCQHCGRRLSEARVQAGQNTCPSTGRHGVKCWEMVYTPEWHPEET